MRGQEGGWQPSHCGGDQGLVPGAGGQGEVPCLRKGFREPCWPPGGEVFLPWRCFSAVSGILEKSCLVSVPASNSLSIVTLTNNPTEVRAVQGNKTRSVSELMDARVGVSVS